MQLGYLDASGLGLREHLQVCFTVAECWQQAPRRPPCVLNPFRIARQAKQGTANLVQGSDIQGILSQVQPTGEAGLAAAGLVYKNDDEDVNFDDD